VRIQLVIGIARINGAWPFSPRPAIEAAARDSAALLVLNNLMFGHRGANDFSVQCAGRRQEAERCPRGKAAFDLAEEWKRWMCEQGWRRLKASPAA
jgi:hypothetical protein